MHTRIRLSFVAVLLLLAAPALHAQRTDTTRFDRLWGGDYDGPRRLELGVSAGYALSTDWSDLVALHLVTPGGSVYRQVLMRNVAVAPGAGGAVNVTYWRGRHGFRVHAGYSQSCLTTASRCVNGNREPPEGGAALAVAEVPMDIYRYGVDGLVGLRDFEGSRFWRPFLVVGFGGVMYDTDEDALPLFPGTFETVTPPPGSPPNSVIITDGTSTLLVSTDELGLENVFGVTLGAGMDFRIPLDIGGLAVRVELADQITSSPFKVRVVQLESDGRCCYGGGGRSEAVFRNRSIHNLRLTAGVGLEFPLRGPRTEFDPSIRSRR